MTEEVGALEVHQSQPMILLKLEFYRGLHNIADFLNIHEKTAQRLLASGKIPGKKDGAGTWVLVNLDYYQSLQG